MLTGMDVLSFLIFALFPDNFTLVSGSFSRMLDTYHNIMIHQSCKWYFSFFFFYLTCFDKPMLRCKFSNSISCSTRFMFNLYWKTQKRKPFVQICCSEKSERRFLFICVVQRTCNMFSVQIFRHGTRKNYHKI